MKCPMCDGMGTSNICVNGTFKTCAYCNGTGEVGQEDENDGKRAMKIDLMGNVVMIDDFADNVTFSNGTIILTNVEPPIDATKYHGVELINTLVLFEGWEPKWKEAEPIKYEPTCWLE